MLRSCSQLVLEVICYPLPGSYAYALRLLECPLSFPEEMASGSGHPPRLSGALCRMN